MYDPGPSPPATCIFRHPSPEPPPGTIVYDGMLDGRPVAVKRLLRQFFDLAKKEIDVLIVSDEHPNVVRCFAMEEDREFVYLALERCRSTLADLLNDPKVSRGAVYVRCRGAWRGGGSAHVLEACAWRGGQCPFCP